MKSLKCLFFLILISGVAGLSSSWAFTLSEFGALVSPKLEPAAREILQRTGVVSGVPGAPIVKAVVEPMVEEMVGGYINPDNTVDFEGLYNGLQTPTQIRTAIRDTVAQSIQQRLAAQNVDVTPDQAQQIVDALLSEQNITMIKNTAQQYSRLDRGRIQESAMKVAESTEDSDKFAERILTELRNVYPGVSDEVLGDAVKVMLGTLGLGEQKLQEIRGAID